MAGTRRTIGATGQRAVRIAVTRPVHSAGELADLLRARGADPVIMPLTRIVPPPDTADLQSAIARIHDYDWVVFTSVNAVRAVADAIAQDPVARGADPPAVAAVGSATAAGVRDLLGWDVAVVPPEFTGEALVPAMAQHGLASGAAVLWPRAEHAREAVSRALAVAGARLDAPIAYTTRPDSANARELARLAERGLIDVILFTAPSAVEYYAAAAPTGDVVHGVIGPATAEAARAHGLAVHVQPREHTVPALVDSVFAYLGRD